MGIRGLLEVEKIKTAVENIALTQYTNKTSSTNDKYLIAEGYKAYNGTDFVDGAALGSTEANKKIITNNFEDTDVLPRHNLSFISSYTYFTTGSTEAGIYYPSTITDYKTATSKVRKGKKALYNFYTGEVYRGTGNFIDNNSSNLVENTVIGTFYKDSSTSFTTQTDLSPAAGLSFVYPTRYNTTVKNSFVSDENEVEFGRLFVDLEKLKIKLGNMPIMTADMTNDPFSVGAEVIVLGPGKMKLFRKAAYNKQIKVLIPPVLIPRKEYAASTPSTYKDNIADRTLSIGKNFLSLTDVAAGTITSDKYYSLASNRIVACRDFSNANVNYGTRISNIAFSVMNVPSTSTIITNKKLNGYINLNITDEGSFDYKVRYDAEGALMSGSARFGFVLNELIVAPVLYSNGIKI